MSPLKVTIGCIALSLLLVLPYGCASVESSKPLSKSITLEPIIPTPTRDNNSPTGYYIPVDIPDAHRELDIALSNNVKTYIKKLSLAEVLSYQNTQQLMVWIDVTWGLDPEINSRLMRYFTQQGVTDDLVMIGILMCSYRDYLAGVKGEKPGQRTISANIRLTSNARMQAHAKKTSLPTAGLSATRRPARQ